MGGSDAGGSDAGGSGLLPPALILTSLSFYGLPRRLTNRKQQIQDVYGLFRFSYNDMTELFHLKSSPDHCSV